MQDSDRTKPPLPLTPVEFNVPSAFRTGLDSGLRIMIVEDDRLPLVSYRLAFRNGDVNDPPDLTGATSATASMLNEGTQNYSSRQLADEIERLGASISVSASDDFTVLAASALSLYSSAILGLAAEIVLKPTFPENELELYRRNTIENLKFQRSQPGFLAGEQAARLLFGEHPYSRVAPGPQDVERLSREDIAALHKQVYIPNSAFMMIVGDVDREAAVKEIRDLFGGWQPGEMSTQQYPEFARRSERTLTIVDRPGSAQANIVLANLAIGRRDPDYFSLLVMNQVLGAGASSRVFMNLREDKGYTYGAYTRLDAKRLGGSFEATAEVRTAVTGDSLREFFFELDRIRDEKVSDLELNDAKNFLTGVFPIRAETQEGLTNLFLNQQLYELPEDYLQTYRRQIDAVSADDVRRVARLYVRPEEMAMVIVGDAREIIPQAAKYADAVEVFDTDGKRLESSDQAVTN